MIKKNTVILFLSIGLVISLVSKVYLFSNNEQIFDARSLPSELVEIGQEKCIGIPSSAKGYLVYGPYCTVPNGKKEVSIYYNTNSDSNFYNVYSFSNSTIYTQGQLPKNYNVIKFTFDSNILNDLEVRIGYSDGTLQVSRIIIQENNYSNVSWFIFSFVVILILLFCGCAKDIYMNNKISDININQ